MPSKAKPYRKKKAKKGENFPLVAIGASAGGLEAVTQLLSHLPADTGMAYIFVQHLSPDYKSMLAGILAKTAKMKVREVKNGTKIGPDIFYVIPPNKAMTITDGHLKLSSRNKKTRRIYRLTSFFIL